MFPLLHSWPVGAERHEQGEEAEAVGRTLPPGRLLHQRSPSSAQVPGVPSGAVPQVQGARARRLNCGLSLFPFPKVLNLFLLHT